MIIRSKAPFRLGIAGGADVSPYSELYGGAILNVTVNLYSYATIKPLNNGKIIFRQINEDVVEALEMSRELPLEGNLLLQRGIYNSIVRRFNNGKPLSFELTTYMDVPSGSGLGTSSTVAVSIIGAFKEWLKLPLGEYDIAQYAYEIEHKELRMAGGKQDQYAATFGGVNFMEFYADNKVIVNPLRIHREILDEWGHNTLLYFTDTRRKSARIIEEQSQNVVTKKESSIEAMHKVKSEAYRIKNLLLRNELNQLGVALNDSWEYKKQMAKSISTPEIDDIYKTAVVNGALGGKISGAGGGGFMFFYCPGTMKYAVAKALEEKYSERIYKVEFVEQGLTTWTIKD
ncbi:MAG: dehydrogenase [Bacteroides sp.]|nr:dehydrogenase [Bacteroides sp.]